MLNLKPLLEPMSVAVIGASRDSASVGYGILKSLLHGCVLESKYCKPFPGKVFPVNPNAKKILGRKCFASALDVPGALDLAVVAVPAKIVPVVLKECGRKGVKAVVVVSAGFAETGNKKLQYEVVRICKENKMLLLGPNCLGVLRPGLNLNASFGLSMPPSGGIAFVTQSGALAYSVIDWAIEEMYAFSAIVSLGNAAGLDESDFLEWFARDRQTKAIALYLEGVRDGKRFMNALREAVHAGKKVFVLKAGRFEKGLRAVASHTAAMAGSFDVFSSAVRQAGGQMVESLEELFDLAKAVSQQPLAKKNAVVVVTNGGGAGALTADYCQQYGVNLVELKKKTVKRLARKMHSAFSRRNPLDVVGDALPQRYEDALNAVLAEPYVHAAIVIQTMQTMTDAAGNARAVIKARKRFPRKPIACVFMGGKYTKKGIQLLYSAGVPVYSDPLKAVKAMAVLCK